MSSAYSQQPTPEPTSQPRYKSKTLAAFLAFAFGSLGLHRYYLRGIRDPWGWLHLAGLLLGVVGAYRLYHGPLESIGGWALALCGVASLTAAFLTAIVFGLRADDKWDARFNEGGPRRSQSGWAVIFVVIFALFIGTGVLMGTLALAFQTYFESIGITGG